MRRMWMLLFALVLTVIIMAVPAMAATEGHGECLAAGTHKEGCAVCGVDHEADGWTALTDGLTISADGYYYVNGATNASVTVTGGNVVICLNGSAWTNGAGLRPLTVKGGSVKLVDCSDRDAAYVSAGTITGANLYAVKTDAYQTKNAANNYPNAGGTVLIAGGTVTMYNGTLVGGQAAWGGNVAVIGNNTLGAVVFNFYGGKISGDSKANLTALAQGKIGTDGLLNKTTTISGLAYNRGGNVALAYKAQFVMGNEATAAISNATAVPVISGGVTKNNQGGAVGVQDNSVATMNSGLITLGTSCNIGGNVYMNGSGSNFIMNNGLITGGYAGATPSATGNSANVAVVGSNFTMTGGEIANYFSTSDYQLASNAAGTKIYLSGTAKITGSTGLYLDCTVGTAAGTTYKNTLPLIVIADDFETGAKIQVSLATGKNFTDNKVYNTSKTLTYITRAINRPADMTDDAEWEAYANGLLDYISTASTVYMLSVESDGIWVRPRNMQLLAATAEGWEAYENSHLAGGIITLPEGFEGGQLTFESGGIYVRPAEEMWHCVCCADQPSAGYTGGNITHIGTCDKYDHKWEAYAMNGSKGFPYRTTAGTSYYYLTDGDSNKTDGTVINPSQTNYNNVSQNVYIDLNGLKFTSHRRVISLNYTKDYDIKVVLTDSVGTGEIEFHTKNNGSTYVPSYEDLDNKTGLFSGEHSFIWATGASGGSKQIDLYRITVDGSDLKIIHGLIAYSGKSTGGLYDVTIHGADITCVGKKDDGKATAVSSSYGSCLEVSGTASVTIDNSTLNGDKVRTSGGAIYMTTTGTLTITNSTINGAAAGENGGAICQTKGALNVSNTTISGGKAERYGGNIYQNGGTSTYTGCVIKNGVAVHTADEVWGRGANVYTASTMTLTNCTISGGVIEHAAGQVFTTSSDDEKYLEYGGTAIYIGCSSYEQNGETGPFDVYTGKEVIIDSCRIYGNADTQVIDGESLPYNCLRGGTIYTNSYSKVTIKGDTLITASRVKDSAAAVYIANAEVLFQDNTIIDASCYYTENENGQFVKNTEMPVSAYDGVALVHDNGFMSVTLEDNAQIIGGNAEHMGGAAKILGGSNLYLRDSAKITGGTAGWGGTIHVSGGGTILTMSGANCEISGGQSTNNGGAVYIDVAATFNMSAGTIKDGESTNDQGGNLFCAGTLNLTGGTIKDGSSKKGGGNVVINSSYPINIGAVTIQDGESDGYGGNLLFNMTYSSRNITLNGTTITGGNGSNGGNLCVSSNNSKDSWKETPADHSVVVKLNNVNISGGDATAVGDNIAVACASNTTVEHPETKEKVKGNAQYSVTVNIYADDDLTDETVTHSVIGGYPAVFGAKDDVTINIVDCVAHVNNYNAVYATLADATANRAATDYVTMMVDAADQTVSGSCYLDLNGKALTGLTVNNEAEIKLFDSTAIDYVAGNGFVTLAENQTNPFVRDFTTKGIIDRNLRFVTIKQNDGKYTAHRIYLAVRSTVLYPKTSRNEVAIGFRIALRCDDTLKDYITGYGLVVGPDPENMESVNLLKDDAKVSGDGANNDNTKVVGMGFGTTTGLSETEFTGNAFIVINDGAEETISSSAVVTSLMSMVKSVDEKYDTLSDTQKGQLVDMLKAYQNIMSGWNLKNIKVPETETQD